VRALIPLGLAKLFVDQVVPTAGVGGTLLVVHGLIRRGVPQGLATAALLMDLLSFYAAHGLAIDSHGSLYVVDAFNHRIQKVEVDC
jgi:hypothetical protein